VDTPLALALPRASGVGVGLSRRLNVTPCVQTS